MAKQGIRRYIGPKRIVIGTLATALVGLSWFLRKHGFFKPELVFEFITAHQISAPLLFILIYTTSLLLMVPTLPLNLGAGVLWGTFLGGTIAMAGSYIGVIGAFILARGVLGQPLAQRFDSRITSWLQSELEQKGWLVVAFTRINPIFPSGPLNFLFGLTSIKFSTYAWSSFVFLLPFTYAFGAIGHEIGSFVLKGKSEHALKSILVVSGIITCLTLLRLGFKMYLQLKQKEIK